ncbi:hypothetical protein [Nocardia sp. NRRL WC-3656]|uniref:hypothetical protein n=1 Tax=Nocardia sp. NRRL WC-3656 TaxID=1463824 RepID=UPI000A7448D7|nr:hypothetical protein [Nocardia sp. NRRL WC-3656]
MFVASARRSVFVAKARRSRLDLGDRMGPCGRLVAGTVDDCGVLTGRNLLRLRLRPVFTWSTGLFVNLADGAWRELRQ